MPEPLCNICGRELHWVIYYGSGAKVRECPQCGGDLTSAGMSAASSVPVPSPPSRPPSPTASAGALRGIRGVNAEIAKSRDIDWGTVYSVGYSITFFIVFVGCWIYCIATYGFLFGVGLGWLPSLIVAAIVSIFWPLIVLLIIILAFILIGNKS